MNHHAKTRRIAIIGTVGVPGQYGGFETLADNLVRYHERFGLEYSLDVYCSAKVFNVRPSTYRGATLRYINLEANGRQSILYDIAAIFTALRRKTDSLLILGVSGALSLPLVRLTSHSRLVTNIDGIEWRRSKWGGLAKMVLRISEWTAVKFSHTVIADNQAIADYVLHTYGRHCEMIPYGGDHALSGAPALDAVAELPADYALALCRIEPENNISMILEAFAKLETPLVFIGNWEASDFGRNLKARYRRYPNIIIHDPIYEPKALKAIRTRASIYVHGHSAGGTNPSLVEMMHFGIPILAYGCSFNQHTTEGEARYFSSAKELRDAIRSLTDADSLEIGDRMREIARQRYTWESVGQAYFELL